MSRVQPLPLHAGDRRRLEALCGSAARPGVALRARIVLLAAEGLPVAEIAARTGASPPTVTEWRRRYAAGGAAALDDRPRSGRPREVDEVKVMVATLAGGGRPPERLAAEQWTARLLGAQLGVSFATVARIWRHWELTAGDPAAFRFATVPALDAAPREVVGLFLQPPDRIVVLSPQPPAARPGHDCVRQVAAAIARAAPGAPVPYPTGLLDFFTRLVAAHPGRRLDVLLDDAGRTHPAVLAWLAARPRCVPYVTTAPWLPVTQVLFGIAGCQAGRVGAFEALDRLADGIAGFEAGRSRQLAWLRSPLTDRCPTAPTPPAPDRGGPGPGGPGRCGPGSGEPGLRGPDLRAPGPGAPGPGAPGPDAPGTGVVTRTGGAPASR